MKKLYFWSVYSTVLISMIVSCLFFTNHVLGENSFVIPNNNLQISEPDTQTVVLQAAAGRVKVYLPDDIRPGDTISGTVSVEPEGQTQAERDKNSAELSGYVVEIAGSRQSSSRAPIRFGLTEGKETIVILKSKTGATITTAPMRVQSVAVTTPRVSVPTAEDFHLPNIGQQNRPLVIHGPFDGSFENTRVHVGEKPAELVAESPRKAVFQSPDDVSGPTQLALNEGSVQKTAPFRNVGINLTAPKTNLMKGEKTTLTVEIIGLQGLNDRVPVQIVATGSVNMSGGNVQNMVINPGKVNSTGAFTKTFNLTGTQAGTFGVRATVIADPDAEEQEQAKCKCTCELNTPPILSGGTAHSYTASVKTAKCEGKREDKCKVSSTTYSWSVVAADSTAEYKVRDGTKTAGKFEVEVTKSGTLTVSVTVTVTCSDGSKCSTTGNKTFDVKK